MLTAEELEEIEQEAAHYPAREAVAIDALRIVQRHRGYISDQSLIDVAQLLGSSPEELDALATFYNLLFRKPVGRHVILLCDSVVCWTMGCEKLREQLMTKLSISPGQTTADHRFTLLPTACLGACHRAPVLMIDHDTHFDVRPDQLNGILSRYP